MPTEVHHSALPFRNTNSKKSGIGRKLRVFSSEPHDLEALNLPQWLERLHDYVHITGIRSVPDGIEKFARFTRLQTKTSKERLARRAVTRHKVSYEEALEARSNFEPRWSSAPYLQLKSLGNGRQFRLILKMEETDSPGDSRKGFNSYGLSKGQALPCF